MTTRTLVVEWRTLLAAIILVVLFIPIRRYTLPGRLPFELEPYRLLVILVVAAWIASLLVDPRVRLRATRLEAPLALFAVAILGSLLANPDRVGAVGPILSKKLAFIVSYVFLLYLIVSVVSRLADADFLCKVLVGGGALVGLAAVVESQTSYNVFNELQGAVPLLRLSTAADAFPRGTGLRAYASAQHPIALGAMLVMLLPLAVYLERRTRERRWWLAAAVIVVGAVATVSRTAVLMLLAAVLVLAILRPRDSWRLIAALVVILALVQVALPGALESLRDAFFPQGGLISEQAGAAGTLGQGRVADLAPTFHQVDENPLLGRGFGTLVPVGPDANALILDNQWLGTLLETGIIGVGAVGWLLVRFIRLASREAVRDVSGRGWLLAAITASTVAYTVGMLTYDAFSFVQVTFVFFVVLGVGAALLAEVSPRSAPSAQALE